MEFEKTTREQRRQTLAKLVLGHLVDPPLIVPGHILVHRRGEYGTTIAADPSAEFPSEALMAHVALALDQQEYESCRMADLDDLNVDAVLGVTMGYGI